MDHYLIGLTGNIAAGKSTVARLLAARGATVIDADQLARVAVAPGTPGLAAVVARFGPDVRRPDGSLDRSQLGHIVFADPAALADLEAIIHPLVGELKAGQVAAAPTRVVVVEAIKLIEVGYHLDADALWVVTAPETVRLVRLMTTRGLAREDAQRRIDSQPPEADKVALADVVLVNDGDEAALAGQVDTAWAAIPPA